MSAIAILIALVALLIATVPELRSRRVFARSTDLRRIERVERSFAPRCAHCGARQQPGVRMIAGWRAYICERCIRRAAELLDAPDDITRFL